MRAVIYQKTTEEIELMRASSQLVSRTLALMAEVIQPGMTTLELDKLAEQFIRDHHGEPAFLGYRDFPNSLCISVNEEVVHGIPSNRIIQEGDLVSVDCGVKLNGWFGDSAYTFAVGEIGEEEKKLLEVTKESLRRAVAFCVVGNRIGDLSYTVQDYCEYKNGYGVVRDLVGHGIGKSLHEDPEVPNFGRRGTGTKLKEGMVIAVEPMINMGTRKVYTADDKWTVYSQDRKPSAHFEHTVAVGKSAPDILTTFSFIDAALEKRKMTTVNS